MPNTIHDALLLIVVAAFLVSLIFGILSMRAWKKESDKTAELLVLATKTSKAYERLDRTLREGHLTIMRALKGDNYQGTFGGVDVMVDDHVPADFVTFPFSPGLQVDPALAPR